MPDSSLTKPGYNDGGEGNRIYYTGEEAEIADGMDAMNVFLTVMEFESMADRTNTVAFALTVMLHNHWLGGKPIAVVTATKSHAGKDTIIDFASGPARSCSVTYEAADWALKQDFVRALKEAPETVVMVIGNARLQRRNSFIASQWVEHFATEKDVYLSAPGTGEGVWRRNDVVIAMSTNFGSVSEDIMNRSLPIHLDPLGDVASRNPDIGNPRHEYLPNNEKRIAAELRGMIERWKDAGMPLDENVRHPFKLWAETIGGILMVNGFGDFLANYGERKTTHDPVRQSIGILGAAKPGEWLSPDDWARLAVEEGVSKMLMSGADSERARKRAIGVVLSAHRDETFETVTETENLTLRLRKQRRRWETGREATVRYCFEVLDRCVIPEDASEGLEDLE